MSAPETRYAKTVDGVNIAYQVRGEGPVDLVYVIGMASNFEIEFEAPWGVRFLDRLGMMPRVILFDKRGTGLSDRGVGAPDFDMRADDLRAVLDGARSDRAVLFGDGDGGSLAALFAAMHPDRVLALVLYNSNARGPWAPDYPIGWSKEEDEEWRADVEHHWGSEEMARRWMEGDTPSRADDPFDTAGDGFFATFDGPARGVRRARSIVEAVEPLGIEIRAGLHTGEVDLSAGGVHGIAVHIGARVGALAGPSEVLVSQTVKDLVAGSGLAFEDAGEHEMKGVPDRWRLYRVVGA